MKRINMTDENWATAIKIAAVMVAVPRWIGALLEADGVPLLLTKDTAPWWGLFSAFASAGMALVEGVAFWYTLRAWRQHGGKFLGALIALSMAAFAIVLTPYIMAQVSKQALNDVLAGDWLIVWAGCVSLSTILIVASVGYAQPRKPAQPTASTPQVTDEDCHCPICRDVIGLPVWLFEQHGDKYLAYCDKCKRAYTEAEVIWLPSTPQVGATMTQPIAQGPQVPQTDEICALGDDAGQDVTLESPQMPLGGVSRAVVVENTLPAVSPNEAAQIAVLEHAPVTTADIILEYVKRNPSASKVEIAQHVARAIGSTYTRQAVAAQLQRLEVAGRIARNGHVEVLP